MAFTSEWKTNNTGTSNDDQISLPLVSGGTYNFLVQWGDGNNDTITVWNEAATTHTYASAGTYTVTITGTITGWQFNNGGDKLKILDISEWDVLRLTDTGKYFYGCSNLDVSAADGLVVTGISTLYRAFFNCLVLTSLNTSGWDTSSVTTFRYLFFNCQLLTTIDTSGWDTSLSTTFYYMFYNCQLLTTIDISGWDTSLSTTFRGMFQGCSSLTTIDTSGWDTSLSTTFDYMFYGAIALTTIGNFTLSGSNTITFSWGRNDIPVEVFEIDKPVGTVTLGSDITCDSFLGTSGILAINGQTITTTNSCDWLSGFDFYDAAYTMDGSTWIVGGAFSADGQTLNATSTWTLTVSGATATAMGVDVQYCDASGGTEIYAIDLSNTDSGNNLGWLFFFSFTGSGGVVTDGAADLDIGLPFTASGGVVTDGIADLDIALPFTGSGGVVTDGTADLDIGLPFTGSGGVVTDGNADLDIGLPFTGSGSVATGGAAGFGIGLPFTASGSVATGGIAGRRLLLFGTTGDGERPTHIVAGIDLFGDAIERTQANIARLQQISPRTPIGGSFTEVTIIGSSPPITDALEQAIAKLDRLRNITNIKIPDGGSYQVITSKGR